MTDTSTEDRQTKEAEETVQKKTDRQSTEVKKIYIKNKIIIIICSNVFERLTVVRF